MNASRIRRLTRAALATTIAASAFASVAIGTQNASAMTPAQSQYSGVVNVLSANTTGSLSTFWATTMRSWGKSYAKPPMYYYHTSTIGNVSTPCGASMYNNSFYCRTNNSIYLDYTWNQSMLNQYGDFGPGGILAHEWGHAIQAWLGYSVNGYRREYNADCLTGMYVRYGYAAGKLNGTDYGEMYNWLYYQNYSASHGRGSARAAWYEYGYTQYNLAACAQAFSLPAVAAKVAANKGTETGPIGITTKNQYDGKVQAPPAPPVKVTVTGTKAPSPTLTSSTNLKKIPASMQL